MMGADLSHIDTPTTPSILIGMKIGRRCAGRRYCRRLCDLRMGSAKEVAEAVVWLCSLAASFVTSHAKVVDGGHSRPNGLINLLK